MEIESPQNDGGTGVLGFNMTNGLLQEASTAESVAALKNMYASLPGAAVPQSMTSILGMFYFQFFNTLFTYMYIYIHSCTYVHTWYIHEGKATPFAELGLISSTRYIINVYFFNTIEVQSGIVSTAIGSKQLETNLLPGEFVFPTGHDPRQATLPSSLE